MSEAKKTTKEPPSLTVLLALAAVAFLGFHFYVHPWFKPPREAEIRKIAKSADEFIGRRANELDQDYLGRKSNYTYVNSEGKKRTDPNRWFFTGMAEADQVRDDGRRVKAIEARAGDRDESVISTEAEVYQNDWSMMREIRVPTYITVVGQVTPELYPNHRSTPDGIAWSPNNGDRTVLMEERNKDELGKYERLNAAIGKLCVDEHGVNCRPGLQIGSRAVLCVGPGFHEGGYFGGWYDGMLRIGGTKMHLYFSGAEKSQGKFKFVFTPDDPPNGRTFATDICSQNSGALVVQNPVLRTPVNTTS